jgi:hypothetical protein
MVLPDGSDGYNGRKFSIQIQRNMGIDTSADDRCQADHPDHFIRAAVRVSSGKFVRPG